MRYSVVGDIDRALEYALRYPRLALHYAHRALAYATTSETRDQANALIVTLSRC